MINSFSNKQVKITPKSNRAKNRVREHGDTFQLKKGGSIEGKVSICCKSLNKTWNNGKEFWIGWFDNEEADWKILENS